MDPRDQALQAVTPTVMVPRFTAFEPLVSNGHRFLSASDGLWLEVRRPWLYLRKRIAEQTKVAMPYGILTEEMEFAGRIPRYLIDEFVQEAARRCPSECAAWVTWHESTWRWQLRHLEEQSASADHVDVIRPVLPDGEHLVLDLHSHGRGSAFFSRQDNLDDHGEYKIAGVVGHVDTQPVLLLRLCAGGLFIPINV